MGILKNPRKVLPQVFVALAASIAHMNTGLIRGWSSPGIPSIRQDHPFNVTEDEYTWISSVSALAAVFSSICAGLPVEMIGRKMTMLLSALPMTAGWLLVGFSVNAGMIIGARALVGVLSGVVMPSSQLFIGECASPRIRGILSSFTALSLAIGVLIAYVFGSFMPWNELAWLIACFPTLFGIAVFFCPESPVWLLSKGREDEARKALQTLRGPDTDIKQELARIQENIDRMKSLPKLAAKDYFQSASLKPLSLSMALMFFQQFSGINAITYYTVAIFQSAGTSIDDNLATIIVGTVQLVFTGISTTLVDKAGRRVLLMFSSVSMAVSLTGLGTYFYLKEVQGDEWANANIGWLPLLALIMFIIVYSAGYINIPYVIMGELFPVRYRSVLGTVSNSFNVLCGFLVIKFFPSMQQDIGSYGAFWLFSGCCVLGFFFVFFFLPETKGKTLEDIEQIFAGNVKKVTANIPVEDQIKDEKERGSLDKKTDDPC